MEPCLPDVDPATVQSYLTRRYGEPLGLVWTSTSRHSRVDIGWAFPGGPAAGTDPADEIFCIPAVIDGDGTLHDILEMQADQRQDVERVAASGAIDSMQVITAPPRDYQPAASAAAPDGGPGVLDANGADESRRRDTIHQTLTQLARDTGATFHAFPRPGPAVRRVVLRNVSDSRGTRFEAAQVEHDGTLRIIGQDRGPGVSEFFGTGITSYDWIYTVQADRITSLTVLAGGQPQDDPLDTLAAYYRQHNGRTSELLTSPKIGADFSNWPS